jgi:DNA repair ATPase RecN
MTDKPKLSRIERLQQEILEAEAKEQERKNKALVALFRKRAAALKRYEAYSDKYAAISDEVDAACVGVPEDVLAEIQKEAAKPAPEPKPRKKKAESKEG